MRSPAGWWRGLRAEWLRGQRIADDAAVIAALGRHPTCRAVYLARRTKLPMPRVYAALSRLERDGLAVVDEREPAAAFWLRHWRPTTLAERAGTVPASRAIEAVRRG